MLTPPVVHPSLLGSHSMRKKNIVGKIEEEGDEEQTSHNYSRAISFLKWRQSTSKKIRRKKSQDKIKWESSFTSRNLYFYFYTSI